MDQYAILTSAFKGFEDANTNAQSPGYVKAGKYIVEELRTNFPNEDTDYARILVPYLGSEETWICTRWKDRQYVELIEKAAKSTDLISFDDDPRAVDEQTLTSLLDEFHDFTYDLDIARYPFDLPGFKTPLSPPQTNNCCTFVEAWLVKAWNESFDDFAWNMERHKQMMIYSSDDYFSPVTALIESNMAESVSDDDQPPHPWTVVQGWRKQWTSGHTFIIVDHHENTDRVLTLESNSSYKLNGVGYRMIGNLQTTPQPPNDWWNNQLWTWEKFKSIYQFRKQCILKIRNRNWAQSQV